MRSTAALAALVVVAAGCGTSDPTPIELPVAPMSTISVATAATTFSGSVPSSIVSQVQRCPAAVGVGVLAETPDAAVIAIFPRRPVAGSVFDLSLPGAEDSVIVSAHVGNGIYCTDTAAPSGGTIWVRRFEQVGSRYLVDIVLGGVVAGPTTIDAHLYH